MSRNPFWFRAGFNMRRWGHVAKVLHCCRNPFWFRAGFNLMAQVDLAGELIRRNPFWFRAGFNWIWGMVKVVLYKSQSLLIQGRFQQGFLEESMMLKLWVAIPSDSGQVSTQKCGGDMKYWRLSRRNPFWFRAGFNFISGWYWRRNFWSVAIPSDSGQVSTMGSFMD